MKNTLFIAVNFDDVNDALEGLRQLTTIISNLQVGDDVMGSFVDDDLMDGRDYHIAMRKNLGADLLNYKDSEDE